MATEKICRAVLATIRKRLPRVESSPCHLEIGAGRGKLAGMIRESFGTDTHACDFHTERFNLPDVPIKQVDINLEPLPYADDSFDLVTCTEVVEHLENYHALLREAFRVLRPGGLLVLSTPNVLNMNSRLRYMCTGFVQLFGPIPLANEERFSLGSHITPIPYFYLTHSLHNTGFREISLAVDKVQRSSLVKLTLLFPVVAAGWLFFLLRESRRHMTPHNAPLVKSHNSFGMLTSRTIVVSALKGGERAVSASSL